MADSTQTATPAGSPAAAAAATPEVFAIFGAEPEVNAYAMAKYSRSALSMRESLKEMDGQKAEKFLNTFYFQYGHRSIADLAHMSFAVERLSILAAIEVADESRWDGQERSTRYQPFRKTGWCTPPGLTADAETHFSAAMQRLFDEYERLTARIQTELEERIPCPAEMKREVYERTLRARAFDVSRYLLPLATVTSLGQIVSARTLEQQIVRLLSSPYEEVRQLGAALRRAATEPAHDPRHDRLQRILAGLRQAQQAGVAVEEALRDAEALAAPVLCAPTLVKYTDPSPYQIETRRELRQIAGELFRGMEPEILTAVDLLEDEPLEIELPATLLYPHTLLSYRQVRTVLAALPAARREEVVAVGLKNRQRHDELLREFQAGPGLIFDLLMDLGGFRDMHRHRRCVQIPQAYTAQLGYDVPDLVRECGEESRYRAIIDETIAAAAKAAAEAQAYWLPLACRKRCLFKMDFAELAYIAELRTAPAGHISYRRIAWQMLEAARARHPQLTRFIRAVDPAVPIDPLQR